MENPIIAQFSNLLIIQSLLEGDVISLRYKLLMIGFIWAIVLVGIVMDFFSGIEKAKERGEFRSSEGFRRTTAKCKEYYGVLTYAFLFDCLVMTILTAFGLSPQAILPFPTIFAGAFLLRIEFKSFREKASDKQRKAMKDTVEDLITLIKNRNDLPAGIVSVLETRLKEEDDIKNNNLDNSSARSNIDGNNTKATA